MPSGCHCNLGPRSSVRLLSHHRLPGHRPRPRRMHTRPPTRTPDRSSWSRSACSRGHSVLSPPSGFHNLWCSSGLFSPRCPHASKTLPGPGSLEGHGAHVFLVPENLHLCPSVRKGHLAAHSFPPSRCRLSFYYFSRCESHHSPCILQGTGLSSGGDFS